MSNTRKWLDFASYDMQLVMGRDHSGEGNHTLVLAGVGLKNEETLALLTGLGFSRDERFPKRVYWTRSIKNFSLNHLYKQFPQSAMVDWPIERIFPAIKQQIAGRQQVGTRNAATSIATSDNPSTADGHANRSVDDGGPGKNGVLGENSPRDYVSRESKDDDRPVSNREAGELPVQSAGDAQRGSQGAGDGLSQEQSAGERLDASGESSVAQPSEGVRQGEPAQGRQPEHVRTGGRAKPSQPVTINSYPSAVAELSGSGTSEYTAEDLREAAAFYQNGQPGDAIGADPATRALDPATDIIETSSILLTVDAESINGIREAFNQRDYDSAYELYRSVVSGDALDHDAFSDALAYEAGGATAQSVLSRGQRRELHELGLRDSVIEAFAMRYASDEFSLAAAFDLADQHDAIIASAIGKRIHGDRNLTGALAELGFAAGHAALDEPEITEYEFINGSDSIIVSVGKRALHLTGHTNGDMLPVFEVLDQLEKPISEIALELGAKISQVWSAAQKTGGDEADPNVEAYVAPTPEEEAARVRVIIEDIKGVIAAPESLPDFPAGWIVMNAARPLAGHRTKEGNFLDGRYYAAIDPAGFNAEGMIEQNRDLAAAVVLLVPLDQQIEMALVGNDYRLDYLTQFSGKDLHQQMRAKIGDLQHSPYNELLSLHAKAIEQIEADEVAGELAAEATLEAGSNSDQPSDLENTPPGTLPTAMVVEQHAVGVEQGGSSYELPGDEIPEYAIHREWRGAKSTHMREAQDRKASASTIFEVLAQVESGKEPNDFQKRLLTSFKGWGVEGNDLRIDQPKSYQNNEGNQIARHLGMTPADFQRTYLENRLESYYTAPQLADSMWKGLLKSGVNVGGKFLDAGCGAAAFFTAAPDKVQSHATLIGVECDPITVRLARAAAPDATILHSKYEQAVLARDFDAVIGNVPFGSTRIHDSQYADAHHIHDYFILRSLDQLKPGGVMAVITSAGSLDKSDPAVRQAMVGRADMLGAVRLPREAFSHLNASVDTDIVFLQRRPEGTLPSFDYSESVRVTLDQESGRMVEDPAGAHSINRYFLDNPQNLLGQYTLQSTQFGPKPALNNDSISRLSLIGRFDSLAEMVDERFGSFINDGVAQRTDWEKDTDAQVNKAFPVEDWSDFQRIEQQVGNYVGDNIIGANGEILEIVDIAHRFDDEGIHVGFEHIVAETKFSGKRIAIMEDYIGLRDLCRDLIAAQLNGSDTVLQGVQDRTKQSYEAFVKKHGAVNATKNVRVYGDDAGSAEVCALELWDDEEALVEGLADTFSKRVVGAELEHKIETPEDAYFHSIDRTGGIDFALMAEALGQDADSIKQKLVGDLVYFNPVTHEYEPQHEYLSGNVVQKLKEAEQALATMPELQVNVVKLREAQPEPIPFEDIYFKLGVGWIPEADIESFVSELFGTELSARDFRVKYTPEISQWAIEVSTSFKNTHVTRRTTVHGTKDCSFERLLEMQLNSQKPTHYDKLPDNRSVVSDDRTMASRTKQDEIEEAFRTWVTRDIDRMHRYTEMYNASSNTIALPKVSGARLTFPGLAPTWKPRDHQKDIVAMAMMGLNVMAAHCVGAGKTFEMVAIAMKLKQIGMCNKPAIAVPNHMLGQITREAKQMFPSARILQVTADDLKGAARQRFLARVRNNDWDMVVFTHGMMNRIQAPLNIQTAQYLKNIRVIEAKIGEADGRVKRQLEAQLKTVQSRLSDVEKVFNDEQRKSGVLTADQLGIDMINVDEIHLYKNLAINSNMDVLGVTRGGSQRATNLNMLTEFMRQHHGKSFGVNGFTGTPVSNTMCELYVHGSNLRPELFENMGIHDFDEWARRFGDVVSSLEPLPEGGGFRVNERFARFVNLPEMIKLFRTFADVKNPSDLNLPVPEVKLDIVSVEQTDFQKDFMKHLALRATAVRKGAVKPHEDNMLSIASAGRKAALDMQLVHPLIPSDASLKLNAVSTNIFDMWEKHAAVRATQIVFMDMGTPKKDGSFTTYQKLRDLLNEKGIPDRDIAFVHEAKNDAEKEALFEKVRNGDVRVLIGSTEKMGVGTNVQDRLVALHNVDCPWRPSDIEQRIGRIRRQGNKLFDEVTEFRYTTKDSFDLFMWGANQRKGNFIAQGLGDPTKAGREVSEDVDLGYAEVMAVTTGNPKIREKVETDDKVSKMERKRRAWQSDLYTKASENRRLRSEITIIKNKLVGEVKIAAALPKSPYKVVEVRGAVSKMNLEGSVTFVRATETGEAVLARLPLAEARLMKNGEDYEPLNICIGGINLVAMVDHVSQQTFVRGVLDDELLPLRFGISKNPATMGSLVREFFDTAYRTQRLEHELQKAETGYELVKDINLDSEWPQEAEYKELQTTQRELNKWFASQDFNTGSGSDPFLARMAILKAEDARAIRLSELEMEVAANGDTALLTDGFGPIIGDNTDHQVVGQDDACQSRGAIMRMG